MIFDIFRELCYKYNIDYRYLKIFIVIFNKYAILTGCSLHSMEKSSIEDLQAFLNEDTSISEGCKANLRCEPTVLFLNRLV